MQKISKNKFKNILLSKKSLFFVVIIIWSSISFTAGTKYSENRQKSKTEQQKSILESSKSFRITSGVIEKIENNELQVKDLKSELRKFKLSENTVITLNGQKVSKDRLKKGLSLRIVPDQSNSEVARQILLIDK